MIIINNDNEDMTVGSKRFTDAVANALRPHLKDFLNDDELDDFEGSLLTCVTLWWDKFSQTQFMRVFEIIAGLDMGEFEKDRLLLLELMQQDPRFQA